MSKQEHNETTEESIPPKFAQSANQGLKTKKKPPPSMILWRQSPSSLTRDRAPAHRIPKAERFCNTRLDLLKYEQLESMQLQRKQAAGVAVTFPRSTRPEHFTKNTGTPSPASYFNKLLSRGCKSQRSLSSTPSRVNSHAATMNRFFNYHKSYMPQSKHRPYQPECTIDNPSPAHYTPNSTLRSKDIKHSFKYPLKRFKEPNNESPGPAAYKPSPQKRTQSFNAKGTFPKSNRTYLRILEGTPRCSSLSTL